MQQGTIAFYHDVKAYGFIEPADGEDDIFFHISDLEAEEVEEGDEVQFATEESDRGPKAVDIQVLQEA